MSHVLNAPAPTVYIGQSGRSLDGHLWERCWALKNGDLVSSACVLIMVIDTHSHSQTCCMLGSPDTSSTTWPHSTGTGVLCQGSMLYYWSDLTTLWRSIIIVLLPLLILLPPPPFRFLTFCTLSYLWPHHRLTAQLYLYMHACKCWSLTDEGSHSIPTLVPPSRKSSC